MTARLIINADDFGLTPGVNRSIAELFRAGALSSTTLMATGAAFEDAVRLAKAAPGLGVGCHVVLTDGLPISKPALIPTLLAKDGVSLRPTLAEFARAALLGKICASEIEREATAQIARLLDAGLRPTHLDTHKHTHMFPAVLQPLLRVAERMGVPAIRNPFEPAWALRLGHGGFTRRLQMRMLGRMEHSFWSQPQIRSGAVRTTAGALGVSATGSLDAGSLRALLQAMPAGEFELVCHPGFNDAQLNAVRTRLRAHREVEHAALLTVVPKWLRDTSGAELLRFTDLRERSDQHAIEANVRQKS